nr:efflux RND transporter periplasmic adaptor subunit [uncultured Holophaga sp.]
MTAPDKTFSRFRLGGLMLLIVASAGAGILWARQSRRVAHEARAIQAEAAAGPSVRVALVQADGADGQLKLQGEAQPYVSTTLYPKVSGFLRRITVDKGSLVRQGQLLAVVESTETDRDTAALRADCENKQRTAERNRELGKVGALSQQAVDDAVAAARVARERLASQATLEGYQHLTAPFSGVVTQRFADPGAMLQNGGSTATAQPVLTLAQVDRLRVVLYLDQQQASRLKVGTELEVRPTDRPDQVRKVRISRAAGAVDPRTRTLLVEADLDNRDGSFLPGGAVMASLRLPGRPGTLRIPSECLTIRGSQTQVAVVGPEHRIAYRTVTPGEDNGLTVQILQGLQAGEQVVLSPTVTLAEGASVQPMAIESSRK